MFPIGPESLCPPDRTLAQEAVATSSHLHFLQKALRGVRQQFIQDGFVLEFGEE